MTGQPEPDLPDISEEQFRDLTGTGIELRPIHNEDSDLVRRILAMASSWRMAEVPVEVPDTAAAYHEGWGRPDDLGVAAFQGVEFAGGAYLRRVGPADGTYGYFSPEYRELTIGVEPGFRGQGIGTLCLGALQALAVQAGVAGISLSVESDNGARRLYLRLGFGLIQAREGDWLMTWDSPTHREGTPPEA